MSSLVRADSIRIPLKDDSVDLIITSPPYFALRSYTDGGEHYDGQIGSEPTPQDFLEALWAVTAECRRVLKPSGSMWINLGDKYAGSRMDGSSGNGTGASATASKKYVLGVNVTREASSAGGIPAKSLMGLPWRYAIGCIDHLGLILRAEVIWSKPNGLPESVTDRVRRLHEQWFHFTKEPRYFAAVDEVREAHIAVHPLGKLPGSVWEIPSEPLKVPEHIGVDHFAAFPQEWPRRIIFGWSPSGVCTVCGEGRRPVVKKEKIGGRIRTRAGTPALGAGRKPSGYNAPGALSSYTTESTITGYACGCPDTTAPTKPAVVLDPFAGTGTVPMVARALGRYGIGIDLSNDYLRLAKWRVFQSGHAAKTLRRTHQENQGSLL